MVVREMNAHRPGVAINLRCSLWSLSMMLFASLLASSAQRNQYRQQHSKTPACCKTQRLIGWNGLDQRCVSLFDLIWLPTFPHLSLIHSEQPMKLIEVGGGGDELRGGNVTPFQLRGSIKRPGLIEWRVAAHIIHELKVCWPDQGTRAYQQSVHTVNREDKHLRLRLPLTARHSADSCVYRLISCLSWQLPWVFFFFFFLTLAMCAVPERSSHQPASSPCVCSLFSMSRNEKKKKKGPCPQAAAMSHLCGPVEIPHLCDFV